ncbi:hypothetical protein FJR11_17305 [Anabaena sp. UHCC 0187]|nr:hypothetical protein [Anabaena sp. UHCC 0187]
MSKRPYPPAYLRYLQARLSFFRQSAFWGISIFMLLVGMISWGYLLKSDDLSQQQNSKITPEKPVIESDSILSDEDKTIAADIDNLPVLLNDFDQAALSVSLINSQTPSLPKDNQNFLEDVIKKNNADTQAKNMSNIAKTFTPAIEKNPFVTQADNLLRFGSNDSDSQFLGYNPLTTLPRTTALTNISLNDQNSRSESTVLINPLETAIKQSSNYSNGANTSIPITNNLPNPVSLPSNNMGYIQPTVTNQQPNLYPNINSVQTSQTGGLPISGVSPVNSAIPNNPYSVQSVTPVVVNPSAPVGYGIQPPNQSTPSNLTYPASGYRN